MPLFQLGSLQFDVAHFNVHETDLARGADFAPKDIVGARRPREHTGESDEQLTLVGKLFPYAEGMGGLPQLAILNDMRLSGQSFLLTRNVRSGVAGGATNMGWYAIEQLRERSSFLSPEGVGRMIELEIVLMRSQAPSALAYLKTTLEIASNAFVRLFK